MATDKPIATGSPRPSRLAEVVCYTLGACLLSVFGLQLAWSEVRRQQGVEQFNAAATMAQEQARQSITAPALTPTALASLATALTAPDVSQWSPARVEQFHNSKLQSLPPVVGVLEIPSIAVSVPVYPSDSELALDRGAGVIDGMAYPHEPGHVGIAGHRDGYFRALQHVKLGDSLALKTLEGQRRFRVDSITIADISDVHLLEDTADARVTLVTCYPFYYVGNAPQRFIVSAVPDTTEAPQSHGEEL